MPSINGGAPPVLVGGLARLRVPEPDDFPYLYYGLFCAPDNLFRSRLHGDTPSLEEFVHRIGEHAVAQFVLAHVSNGQPFGHAAVYGLNLRDGVCFFEVTTAPEGMKAPESHEGTSLFLDYVFRMWPVRKIYAHLSDFNLPLVEGFAGDSIFETEGILRDHEYYAGQYWDIHVVAVGRERWEQFRG